MTAKQGEKSVKSIILIIGIATLLGGCGRPNLTKEATEVRTVTDASGCRLIETKYLEGRPGVVMDYVKRNVARVGGDSYKVVSTGQDAAAGMQIATVNYEAYDCRKPQ